jgi:hypothetical protein
METICIIFLTIYIPAQFDLGIASDTAPVAYYPEHFEGDYVARELHSVRMNINLSIDMVFRYQYLCYFVANIPQLRKDAQSEKLEIDFSNFQPCIMF